MSGASALKKINARVKKLAKKYPGKKRTTLQKQAGAEFRAGKLKARKPRKAKAKRVKRRKPRRLAAVGTVKRVTRRRSKKRATQKPRVIIRTRTKTVRIGSRRVGSKKSILPVLAVVAAGAALLYVATRRTAPVIVQSTNPVRNNTAQSIMQIAAAAGVVGDQLTKLINTINSSNDSQVQNLYDNVKTDPTAIYSSIAGY